VIRLSSAAAIVAIVLLGCSMGISRDDAIRRAIAQSDDPNSVVVSAETVENYRTAEHEGPAWVITFSGTYNVPCPLPVPCPPRHSYKGVFDLYTGDFVTGESI